MSPENARVFVVEDNDFYQSRISDLLRKAGHSVVLTARNFEEVLEIFSDMRLLDLNVNVTTLDGNLGMGGEGDILAAVLKKRFPEIKRVGVSNGVYPVENVQVNLHKIYLDELGEIVTKL